MGHFEKRTSEKFVIFTFYSDNDEQVQEFVEYIQSTLDDIVFIGYPIHGTRNFSEFSFILDIDNKPNIAREEGNLEEAREDTNNSVTNDKPDDASKENSTQSSKPWEKLKVNDNYKEMVRLIHEGLTAQQIADKLNYPIVTIYKRTSEMRKDSDCITVPYFNNRKQRECEKSINQGT